MVAGGFRIVQLADAPDALPTLARWFVAEWAPYYGPGGPGDATADLEGCRNRDALPIALVALDDDGAVVGTAALKAESVGSEQAAGPWLAAFVVGRGASPARRRHGPGGGGGGRGAAARPRGALLLDRCRRRYAEAVWLARAWGHTVAAWRGPDLPRRPGRWPARARAR